MNYPSPKGNGFSGEFIIKVGERMNKIPCGGFYLDESLISENNTLSVNPRDIPWETGIGINSVQVKGSNSLANADYAVAEGQESVAHKNAAHAEGIATEAKGIGSHTEGQQTMALGDLSHAEGGATTSGGDYSHSEGNNTVTNNMYEHAEGHFNNSHKASATYGDSGNTIHSVGIGNALMNRKNAEEIMQNGDKYIIGIGGYDGTNPTTSESIQDIINRLMPNLEAEIIVKADEILSETEVKQILRGAWFRIDDETLGINGYSCILGVEEISENSLTIDCLCVYPCCVLFEQVEDGWKVISVTRNT